MRIKLDENLPGGLAIALRALGHDADTVEQEGMQGCADPDVWRAAQQEGRFLITQDLDFSDVRRFRPGTHAGLLLVRLARPGRVALMRRILQAFEREDADKWSGCFVVLTDLKLRIHCTD